MFGIFLHRPSAWPGFVQNIFALQVQAEWQRISLTVRCQQQHGRWVTECQLREGAELWKAVTSQDGAEALLSGPVLVFWISLQE